MLTNEQRSAIFQEISGFRAQDLIARLISFHRSAGGREIQQAMEVIRDQFKSAGLEEIRIERFPVGQGHSYWTWDPQYINDRLDAYLAIVSPESEKKVIYHFSETPISLLANSSSTPPKGWEGELVHVGRGERAEDYAGLRVRDKVVLTHGRASLVHQRAVVERGAAGMLATGTPASGLDHPDKIMASGVPMASALEHPFFGFSLSHRQYQVLREALNKACKDKKSLRLLARVKTRFRQGYFRALSAVIRGTEQPAKELILVAHICHPKPSANDNASGCALLAEMARTLRTLQKQGDLPPLRRSLRFLIVPEWRGTTPWLYRNRHRVKNMLGVVSLDMVGEDQVRCGGPLMVGSTHGVQQHFIGGLLAKSFRWVAAQKGPARLRKDSQFRWKMEKYFGGTDHMPFVDPTIGVPGLYVGHPGDFFWHTDQDTLDKTDPNTLERVGAASLAFALDLLNLADQEREELLAANYLEAVARLAETGQELVEKTWGFVPKENKSLLAWRQFYREHLQRKGKLDHELAVERAVLASCAQGLRGNLKLDIEEKATELEELLGWQGEEIRALMEEAYLTVLERAGVDPSKLRWRKSALERKADGFVVHRLFQGPFPMTTIFDKAAKRDREWFHEMGEKLWQMHLYEIPFFYINGKRTALEVQQKMEYEYGPLDLKLFLEYLEVLARAKLVRLAKTRK